MLRVWWIERSACWRLTRWISHILVVICCWKCRQSINEVYKPLRYTGTSPGSIALWVTNTSEVFYCPKCGDYFFDCVSWQLNSICQWGEKGSKTHLKISSFKRVIAGGQVKSISPALGKIIFCCPDGSNLNWWAGQLKVAAAVTQLASSENPAAHRELMRQQEPQWQIKEEFECWCANVISQSPWVSAGASMGEKQTSEGQCMNVLIEICQKRFKNESSMRQRL